MSALATWLAGHRARRVVIIAGLFPLPVLGLLSGAAVILSAYLRGPREAAADCLLAFLLLALLGFVSGMNLPVLVGSAAVSWLVWIALGTLAGRSRSLNLSVQTAVLIALAGLVAFVVALGDPVAYWLPVLEDWYADLEGRGVSIPADLAAQAALMSGGLLAFMLNGTLLSLLFGLLLASTLVDVGLGDSFRALRLGYVIGGLAAVAGLLELAGVGLHGALLIFGLAFCWQGIAVVAWWAHRRGWPRSWWLALVILPLLFLGLLVIELTLLAAIGFVDNWFGLRRQRS